MNTSTATAETFETYLKNELNLQPAFVDEIKGDGLYGYFFLDPALNKKQQSRVSQWGRKEQQNNMYFVRLSEKDFLNWDITQGFFGFDTAALLAKGRANLRSGKYKGALRY